MKSIHYKLAEFFILFIILPIVFVIQFPVVIKMSIGGFGFLYIIFVLLKIEKNRFKVATNLNWRAFWKRSSITLLCIALITTFYVWITDNEALFTVLLNKPKLWILILFIYSFFSVYPQELIYRTFFFQRYQVFFKSNNMLIFINAIMFSFGHMFFRNSLVLVLTFLGGLLFAISFNNTRSTLLVSIEHAIYGCWLFTVGMGSMLGFPS